MLQHGSISVYPYIQSHRVIERVTLLFCDRGLSRVRGEEAIRKKVSFFFLFIFFLSWFRQAVWRSSAGSYEWTAPGWCEPGCWTRCSFCTRLGVCLSPGCTGSHGNQGTDRLPSCIKEQNKQSEVKAWGFRRIQSGNFRRFYWLYTFSG